MYQEFFLTLLNIKEGKLNEAKEGGYLEVYCVGIINILWKHRSDTKKYATGKTSPLHMLCDFGYSEITDRDLEANAVHTDSESINIDRLIHSFIEKNIDSDNETDRFRARVFFYSKFKYKSIRKFSQRSGIPYQICWINYNIFEKRIKQEICTKR